MLLEVPAPVDAPVGTGCAPALEPAGAGAAADTGVGAGCFTALDPVRAVDGASCFPIPERAGVAFFTMFERMVAGALTEVEREAAGGGLTCLTSRAPEVVDVACFPWLAPDELGGGETFFPMIERAATAGGFGDVPFGPSLMVVLLDEEGFSCGAAAAAWPTMVASITALKQTQHAARTRPWTALKRPRNERFPEKNPCV